MRGIEQFLQVDAATLGALKYAGTWNASTNTPTLASGVGVQGQYYVVSVAGSTNLDGETAWQVGDWAVFNGSVWQKVDGGSTGLLTTLTVTGNTYLATTSGDVGVGTTSPTAIYGKTLQVGSGTSEASVSLVGSTGSVYFATVGATGQLIARGGAALVLGSNDVERMRITSAGDVGIGTSNPTVKLEIRNDVTAVTSLDPTTIKLFNNLDAGSGIEFLNGVGGKSKISFGVQSTGVGTDDTYIGFSTCANAGALTERMRITSAGAVGIGTSSPAGTLHVYGSGTTQAVLTSSDQTTTYLRFINTTNNGGYVGYINDNLIFLTGSSERMRLDNAGNLGLGVTPSAWSTGSSIEVGNYFLKLSGSGTYGAVVLNNAYYNGGWKYAESNNATMYQSIGGTHAWHTAPSGTAGNAISFTQAMTLDASGNLGLGVTPSAWDSTTYRAFQFGGASAFISGRVGALQNRQIFVGVGAYNNGTNWLYSSTGAAASYIAQNDGAHQWFTAPSGTAGNTISFSQIMTLDASGNLGVGTSSPVTRIHALRTATDGTPAEIRVENGGATGSYAVFRSIANTVNATFYSDANGDALGVAGATLRTTSNHPLIFGTNNAERARIPAAGGMVVGTAALATTATDGFLYVPTCAGTPTGTPTTQTGTAPIVIDTTNNKLYFYSGGAWRDAGP